MRYQKTYRLILYQDWANPLIAKHIRRYPVIPRKGVISEVWHAEKWCSDIERHLMSPMYDAGNERHYFIDEPALLEDEQVVIPLRWLEDEDGRVWFDAWEVKHDEQTVSAISGVMLRIRRIITETSS